MTNNHIRYNPKTTHTEMKMLTEIAGFRWSSYRLNWQDIQCVIQLIVFIIY